MDIKNCRIVYMGTPDISARVLEGLIKKGFNIVLVVTKEDKEVGRKHQIQIPACKAIAEKYGIDCFQPRRIKKEYEFIRNYKPDLILTFSYGKIIPQELIDIPTFKAINLHGSLLPKLRGAAPIQYALINGEKETGVTLMEMIKEMDAGKMYAKISVPICYKDNATTLFDKISDAALKLAIEAVPMYIEGNLKGTEQDENEVTFANMIKPEDEKLKLDLTKEEIHNWIRGLSEEPGGYLLLNDKKLKIFEAQILNDEIVGEVGEIVNADKRGLTIQLKNGQMNLLSVQLEGKKRMAYKDFLNGNQGLLHTILK